TKEALDYLENLNENTKADIEIRCRIIILKDEVNQNVNDAALRITKEYKESERKFTDFSKKNLLPQIFRIAQETYAYVSPKDLKKKNDQTSYLDTNNLPF